MGRGAGVLLTVAACREAAPSSCLPGARESGVWGRPSISSRTGTPVYILGRERTCGPCTPETCGQARGSRTAPGDRPDPALSSTGPGLAAASWGKIYLQVSAGPRSGRGLMGAAGASAKPWGPEDRPADPRGAPKPLGPAPPPIASPSGCSWCPRLGASEQPSRAPMALPQQPGSPTGRRGVRGSCGGCPHRAPHRPPQWFLQAGADEGVLAGRGAAGRAGAVLL